MNAKHISLAISAVAFAVLLSACTKNEDEELADLELSSVCTNETKAVIDGTAFPTEGEIGLSLFKDKEAVRPYGESGYANVKYSYNPGKGKWTAGPSIKVGSETGCLYGYYPFSSTATDIKAIPVTSSLDGDDVMYATPVTDVTDAGASRTAITMNHALARVSVTVINLGYTGNARLSSIKFSGAETAATGTLDATDGSISATNSDVTLDVPEDSQTITSTGTTYDCLLVPSDVVFYKQELDLTLTIDGVDKVAHLSGEHGVVIARNTKSDITIALSNTGIDIAPDFDGMISTAAEWNEFATAYNDGVLQDCSILILSDLDFADTDIITVAGCDSGKKFSGTINGNFHMVKNLHSSKPLFGSIGADGLVTDLVIDRSCSYTVIYGPDDSNCGCFGPFASNLEGKIINCINAASITLDKYNELDNDSDIFIGGLLGCIGNGTATDCVNYGTITLNNGYISSHNACVGGIVAQMPDTGGTVQNCVNFGELVNHSCRAAQTCLGGIVGCSHAAVKGCKNEGDIISDIEARPAGNACEHIFMGGISAIHRAGVLTECVNIGYINTSSAVMNQYIGGIAASLDGTISLGSNTSSGNIHSTGGARCLFYGGLYGRNNAANDFEFHDTPFTGKIAVDTYESNQDYTYVYVGGLIGMSNSDITIKGASGTVAVRDSITIGCTANKSYRLSVGGIIGAAGETGEKLAVELEGGSVVHVPESTGTKVEISGISTGCPIVMKGGSGIKPGSKVASFGGIIGGAFSGGTIENCSSSGDIYFCEASTLSNSNGYPAHVGGIVGQADLGSLLIKGCSATGQVSSYLYNNHNFDVAHRSGACAVGGILGSFGYLGFLTSNSDACTIEDCSFGSSIFAYRGCAGGIAGYVNNARIRNCDFIGRGVRLGSPAGGIVGAAENSSAEGCTVKVDELTGQSGGSAKGDAGGIFGVANHCSIDGCRSFSNVSGDRFLGGLLGNNDANCTIGAKSMCTYGGRVGDTEINDMFYILCYSGCPDLIDVDLATQIGYWNGTL